MAWHLIDPDKVSIQAATAAGSFVALLLTRKYGWVHALTLFGVGQVTAYYWTIPVAHAFGWPMLYYGPIGFFIGALGMLIWGAIIALAIAAKDDPQSLLTWAAGLFRRGRR